jgi:hypothetical protein
MNFYLCLIPPLCLLLYSTMLQKVAIKVWKLSSSGSLFYFQQLDLSYISFLARPDVQERDKFWGIFCNVTHKVLMLSREI